MNDDSEMPRSALVFGARNLGKAIIELLLAEGWAVAGAARSDATLKGVTALGALALRSDVTDATSVTRTLEQVAEAHGHIDLVVNAAAAYGGERSGPFGGGPIAEAQPDAFESWAAAPARSAWTASIPGRPGSAGHRDPGHRRLRPTRHGRPRPVGGRLIRGASDYQRRGAGAARAGHPGHPADRRRRHRAGKRALPGHDA